MRIGRGPAGNKTRRWNELWGRAALVVAALAVGLVLAEIAVRLFDLAPEVAVIEKGRFRLSANPKIGYEPAPLDYDGDEIVFYDYRGASNRLGYRDVDHTIEKPPGRYRLVLLGDSVGAGLKVERYEDTFPYVLQQMLRSRGIDAELLNFSVSGYNTQQELETLKERGLAYAPDLVLLQFCLNDRWLDDGNILATLLEQQRQDRRVPTARLHPVFLNSELLRFLRFRLHPYRRPEAQDLTAYQLEVAGDTVKPSLQELAELSKQHGFDVLVAIFPAFPVKEPYPYHGEHAWIQRAVESTGMDWVDLLADLQDCSLRLGRPIGSDILHPTVDGHLCAGEALARHVIARGPHVPTARD